MIFFRARCLRKRMKSCVALSIFLLLFLFFVQKKFESNSSVKHFTESSFTEEQFKKIGEKSIDLRKHFDLVNGISDVVPVSWSNSANRAIHSRRNSDFDDEYEVFTLSASGSLDSRWTRHPPPPPPPPSPREKVFSTLMTGREKTIVYQILQALEAQTAKYGIRYFLCGGTLLGSYRHHDLIPWDDDVDVYMNHTERDDIYAVLDALSPSYIVISAGFRLKLYSQYSQKTSRFEWGYPYVDINFFKENDTHIFDSDPIFKSMAYRKEKVFPLHRRPLGGLFPFAPYDTLLFLKNTYQELGYCVTNPYDHRSEHYLGAEGVYYTLCRKLKHRFAFVYRDLDPETNEIRETLKIGQTEIQTIVVNEPQDTVGDPFRLEQIGRRRRSGRMQSKATTQSFPSHGYRLGDI